MKKNYQIIVLFFLAMLLFSCASGYTAYKKGDYYKACMDAIDKLKSNPKNEKAQYVLVKSYQPAIDASLREIERTLLGNEENRYEYIVMQYQKLDNIANAIYNCPKANEIYPTPAEFKKELSEAKLNAADYAYNSGMKALKVGSLQLSRQAYNNFIKANDYIYGYKDVLNRIEEAKYQATLRVVFDKPVTRINYQLSADFFSDNLLDELTRYSQNKFIRFFTFQGNNANLDPHQYLVLNFEDFSIGNTRETQNVVDMKRDSVVVGTVTVEGKTHNAYSTVTAKYTSFRREIKSGGILSVRIYDAKTNSLIQQRAFSGEYVWYSSWATYKGDDRALTNEQKAMCKQRPLLPPSDQELFIEFTKPIYSQSVTYLRNFYNNY